MGGQFANEGFEGAGEIGKIVKAAVGGSFAHLHTTLDQPLGLSAAHQIDGLYDGLAGE